MRRQTRGKLIATGVVAALAALMLLLVQLTGVDDGAKLGFGLVIGLCWGWLMVDLWMDELLDWWERTFG